MTVVGSISNFGWGMAIGLSLAFVALFSLLAVVALPPEALTLYAEKSRERTFKGRRVTVALKGWSGPRRVAVNFELVSGPRGIDASLEGEGSSRVLAVQSRFAGLFSGFVVRVGAGDPLGLFVRSQLHELDLALEFLPTFLLASREPITVAAAMLGDLPAGRSGFGQEFYSAEVYNTSSSSKDIMWKREAKLPSDRLYVRVGEANIPETMTVCFLEERDSEERGTAIWMDLASEAIARVALPAILSGTAVRLLHVVDGDARTTQARDPAGLAEMVVWLWKKDGAREMTRETPKDSDFVVVGQVETQDPETMALVLEKPSLVLTWGKRNPVIGSGVAFFTGKEDISGLVAMVLSK
ncbi:MAG: hypothetical protein M1566_05230 [Thaumarchaeota archaeon]|nr:hypothetical protein [Nitrososphaerota archaeon]